MEDKCKNCSVRYECGEEMEFRCREYDLYIYYRP